MSAKSSNSPTSVKPCPTDQPFRPSDAVVDGVHRIANHLYRKYGYHITVSKPDVAVTLEALYLLAQQAKEKGILVGGSK